MNANELADAVYKKYCNQMDDLADKTTTMLRTIPALQAEIEALKEENIGIKAVLDEYRTQIQAEYERK